MAEPRVFRMPSLGADMTEGTVLEWLVQPGDRVHRGDLVAVIKTDKADVEVEVFDDGVIGELLVPVGDEMLPIGTPLATIVRRRRCRRRRRHRPTAVPPTTSGARRLLRRRHHRLPRGTVTSGDRAAGRGRDRVVASPVRAPAGRGARRRPRDTSSPASPDIRSAPPTSSAPPTRSAGHAAPAPVDQASAMRRAIGNLMARSKREIPHYYLEDDIELTHAMAWLAHHNERVSVEERILPAALLYKAVAVAAREMPALNGYWSDGAFVPGDGVHLGVAIAMRGGGLVAPAIHDADQCSLAELMARLRDLTARVRGGRLPRVRDDRRDDHRHEPRRPRRATPCTA